MIKYEKYFDYFDYCHFFIFSFSCKKTLHEKIEISEEKIVNVKIAMENIFISKQNEFWDYEDNCKNRNLYFKFNKKEDYDKYNRDIYDGFELFNDDGDHISGPRTWSIKNDTTFVWNNKKYKIEACSKDSIILTYFHYKEKYRKCKVTFKKVIDK